MIQPQKAGLNLINLDLSIDILYLFVYYAYKIITSIIIINSIIMKFYFRDNEKVFLESVDGRIKNNCGLAIIYGNRKVGKTEFVKQYMQNKKGVYLSINSNNSKQQLDDISNYIRTLNKLNTFIPSFNSWKELFEFFYFIGKEERFYLAIDEFHNFDNIDKNVFYELKSLVEKYKNESSLLILFISSNLVSIKNNFKDKSSPLYGCEEVMLKINPFNLENVINIYKDNSSLLAIGEIIKIYIAFGGLPKYYYLIDNYNLWNTKLIDVFKVLVMADYAPLGIEYKESILNDFSKTNKTYLSILQAIANGNRTISEISTNINMPATTVMKYLIELSGNKNIITRKLPIHLTAKSAEKFGRYFINSFYDNFWFRFVHPNQIYFELRDHNNLMSLIEKEIDDYVYERAYSLLKEVFIYTADSNLINKYFPYKLTDYGAIWSRKYTIDLALVAADAKQLLLVKVLQQNQNEETQFFNKLIDEIKGIYKGYNINLILISKKKLKKEELKELLFENITNISIKEFFNTLAFEKEELIIKTKLHSYSNTVA